MDILEFYTISRYAQWAGSIIIGISCLPYYYKRPTNVRVLGLYSIASILFSFMQEISLFFSLSRTNFIGNGFVLFETLFFSLVFYFATESTWFKRLIVTSLILYI